MIRQLTVCALLLISCGKSKAAADQQQELNNDEAVLDELAEILQRPELCRRDDAESCPRSERSVEGSATPSTGPRILIIDSGMLLTPLTLYRDRVLAHYQFNSYDAVPVQPYQPKIALPTDMDRILSDLVSTLPLHSLDPRLKNYSTEFNRRFGRALDQTLINHGDPIFNLLAEHDPAARFVLLHFPNRPRSDQHPICFIGTDAGLAKLQMSVKHAADEVLKVVAKHNIQIISLSFGDTLTDAYDFWRLEGCKGEQPSRDRFLAYVKAWAEFYRMLGENSGTVVMQAAAYPHTPILEHNREQYYGDCLELKGRIRIGFSERSEAIPDTGIAAKELLQGSQKNVLTCADLFANFDFDSNNGEPGQNAVSYTANGFVRDNKLYPSTSYAVPLAILFLSQLASTESLSIPEAAASIKQRFNKMIVDPYRNGQMPIKPQFLKE